MEKNKTGKYFKYAIGEIILVVVGILIALSINNWNQERLERIEEKVILRNLKKDYLSAIEEFKALNLNRDDLISAAKQITSISPENLQKYPVRYLDSLFSKTLVGPTYNNKAGSLDVLLNSGKINLITNEILKKDLIAWPGYVDDMVEDEIIHNELYTGKYCDIIEKYLSWNDLIKAYDLSRARFEKITIEAMPNNAISTSNYGAILSDLEYINILHRRASYCMISNNESNSLIVKANEIIAIIDSVLDQ